MHHNVYDVKGAAEYLNCSPKTVYALIARGEIKYYRVGRNYRFTKEMLDQFIGTGGSENESEVV